MLRDRSTSALLASVDTDSTRLRRIVWSVILVAGVVRLTVIASSYWWQDDYVHIWNASTQPFADFVTRDWNGHLQPGSMTFYWVMTQLWPQEFWVAVVVLSLLSVGLPVVFWKATSALGGVTIPVVVAACTFAVWPGLLGPLTWLAAGLETFSVLCLLLGVWAFASLSRHRTALILLALLCGLLFNERVLFMLPVLFLTAILFQRGLITQRIREAWRTYRVLWVWLSAFTLAAVIALMARAPQASGGGGTSLVEYLVGLWFAGPMGALRTMAGLAFMWPDERTTVPSQPSMLVTATIVAVWGALLVIGWRRDRRQLLLVVNAWVLVLLVESVLIDLFRGGFIGPQVHLDARYSLISGIMVLIGIASFGSGPTANNPSPSRRPLIVVAAVCVCGASLLSAAAMRQVVDGSAARAWLETARAGFTQPNSPPLIATPSPPFMLNDLFVQLDSRGNDVELGTIKTLLQVGPQQPRFGNATLLPVGADRQGYAAPVTVDPIKSTTSPGFGEDCSVVVRRAWVKVPMSEAGLGNPVLAADYMAAGPTTVQVRAGDWSTTLRLEAGFKTMWFTPFAGPWNGFQLRSIDGPAVCLGSARAGSPKVVEAP